MVSKKQKFRTVIFILILAAAIVGGVFAISYYKGGVTFPWQVKSDAKSGDTAKDDSDKADKQEIVVRVEESKPNAEDTNSKEDNSKTDDTAQVQNPAPKLEYYGPLAVEDGNLVDLSGKPVQLTGVSSHGLSWFPDFITADSIKSLREQWGINVIRLAMYTSDYNGYCVGGPENQQVLKDKIDEAVTAATENQMYVIIDWHILNDNNPNEYKKEAIQFFGEMVRKYGSNENVIYEICNEPNGDTSWADIKSYANEVIPVIRNVDEDAIILVGTPSWSSDLASVLDSPLQFDNIMYTYHFYAATHKSSERTKLTEALDKGLPVFISEYGYVSADGNGAVDKKEAARWNDVITDYNLSSCIWNLSNKNEGSALINSSSLATSNFTYDDLSDQGKYFYDRLQQEKAEKNQPEATVAESSNQGTDNTNKDTTEESDKDKKDKINESDKDNKDR